MTSSESALDVRRLHARLRQILGERLDQAGHSLAFDVAPALMAVALLRDAAHAHEHSESYAAVMVLGRKLAASDLTPTSALTVFGALLDEVEFGVHEEAAKLARAAFVEGFVRGREERVTEQAAAHAADTIHPFVVADGVCLLIPSGTHEAEVLSEKVDELGRLMLKEDAKLAIVDVSQLGGVNAEVAAAVFSAHVVARMLGGRCVFTGVDEAWRAATAGSSVDLSLLELKTDLREGLHVASRQTRAQRRAWWQRLLGRRSHD